MNGKDLFNSFFVSSGMGESFLALDDQEQRLASIAYPLIYSELKRRKGDGDPPKPGSFDVKVAATKENLKKIMDLFRKVHKARDEFNNCFPKWSRERKRIIKELKAIAKSMHKDRFNCNVSRLVGSSVGISGAAALITCLLFPPAAAVVVPLSIAGGGASLAGGGVVFGTSAVEIGLIKSKMGKAQQNLKEDQDSFQPMTRWFEHTMDLVQAVEEVIGFQVMKTLAKDLKDFAGDISSWNTIFKTVLQNTLGVILDAENNFLASLGIHLASIVLTFCVVVCVAHHGNHVVLDSVILSHRLVFGLLSGLDLGVEVGRGIVMAVRGGKMAADISTKFARAVFHGVFGGIGLTLDVINIVLTSIDVHKGSKSKQGTQILQACDKLKEELEFLQKVFDGLKREENRKATPIPVEATSNETPYRCSRSV